MALCVMFAVQYITKLSALVSELSLLNQEISVNCRTQPSRKLLGS
jgi:hypothetical protein